MKRSGFLSLLACALLLGCGKNADDAKRVAQAFWEASKAGDTELAMSYVSKSSTARVNESDEDDGPGDFTLGEVTMDGDRAGVATTISDLGEDAPQSLSFETQMVHEDGEWKVDLDRTMGNMMGSMLGASVGAMAEAMGEAMGAAMEGMAEGMQQGFEALADSMSDSSR